MLCRYAVGVGDAVGDAGDALVPPLLHRIPATCLTPGFTLPWIIGMHQSQEDWNYMKNKRFRIREQNALQELCSLIA